MEVSTLPSGLIASAGIFYFIKKIPFYKKAYLFCCFSLMISMLLFYFSLQSDNFIFQILSIALIGVGGISYYPIALEWAQEECFPASESTIVGVMIAGG
jgi:hypothetical protein